MKRKNEKMKVEKENLTISTMPAMVVIATGYLFGDGATGRSSNATRTLVLYENSTVPYWTISRQEVPESRDSQNI